MGAIPTDKQACGQAEPVSGYIQRMLIPADDIAAKVSCLAERLAADYSDKRPVLVGVLSGSVVFLADLIRQLPIAMTLDFVAARSYGGGTESSGTVELLAGPLEDVSGRHVLLVEDIVDTGLTVQHLKSHLESLGAASVKVCALLDKRSRRQVDVPLDYCGFEVPDQFVVGYGLDFAGQYRNLPFVATLPASEGPAGSRTAPEPGPAGA